MPPRPLSSEPLPLDLVNTEWSAGHGRLLDHLAEPSALRSWLAEHEAALGPVQAADQAVLEPLRTARRAIRLALEGGGHGAVNRVLDHGRIRLGVENGRPVESTEIDDEAWRPAWEAGRAFVELLRTAPPDRIRACADSGCTLWFLDTSRNGRRRWCSMAGCGNRAKARSHYGRVQTS